MKTPRFFDALAGRQEVELTDEQRDALELWSQPNPWHFLTGVWPLPLRFTPARSPKREPKPVIVVMDPIEQRERPFPSTGYEYGRDAILQPIFAESWPTDLCTLFPINKARKVLGTLFLAGGIFTEILDLGSILGRPRKVAQWQILKQNHEESQKLVGDRMRYAYKHENFPAFLRALRPTRPKPVGTLTFGNNRAYAVKQNFSAAKGESTDTLIDECVELPNLRQLVEAARPQTRRIVLIATPNEPGRRGQDPDSVQFFREIIGDVKPNETKILAVSGDDVDEDDVLASARLIGTAS